MKRLLCFGVSLLLVLACSLSIIAAEVPVSTIIRSVDGVQQCVKVYTILPGQDPMELIEGPFEWDGYLYSFFGIETEENYVRVVESHAETCQSCWIRWSLRWNTMMGSTQEC